MKNIHILILIILITYITTKSCGKFIATNKNECFEYSNTIEYCCHITDNTGQSAGCEKIGVAEYPTFRGAKYYDNKRYDYDCGKTYTKNESISCGIHPANETECFKNSTTTDSCCYYNYGLTKGCLLYGEKIEGSMPFGLFVLKCNSAYFTNTFMFIFILFLI